MRKPAKQAASQTDEQKLNAFVNAADGESHEQTKTASQKKKPEKPVGLSQRTLRHTVQIRIDGDTQQRIHDIRQKAKDHGLRWNLSSALTVALEDELTAMEAELRSKRRAKH
jgi:uncharacterized protein (DUF4415 family)